MATLAMLSDLMKTKPLLSTITVQQFVSFLGLVPVVRDGLAFAPNQRSLVFRK
jgi:hypothetical protein